MTKPIPKGQIEWLVNRLHVSTTDAEITADLTRRATSPDWTPAKLRQAIAYAIKCHRKNQDFYRYVYADLTQ